MKTVIGLKMNYTGKQIHHQSELPKKAKLFTCEYTNDLKQTFNVYYTTGKKMLFYILFTNY